MDQINMNNNMVQMKMINNGIGQINPLNNNMGNQMNMNMISNPLNKMNYQFNKNNLNIQMNQMDQMSNIGNQINIMKNEIGMEYKNQNLSIKVRMEDGAQILINYIPDFKMKRIIQCFCIKACIKKMEDYDFIIIKEEKVKLDLNIEQNGINVQKDYILAKKKY